MNAERQKAEVNGKMGRILRRQFLRDRRGLAACGLGIAGLGGCTELQGPVPGMRSAAGGTPQAQPPTPWSVEAPVLHLLRERGLAELHRLP